MVNQPQTCTLQEDFSSTTTGSGISTWECFLTNILIFPTVVVGGGSPPPENPGVVGVVLPGVEVVDPG